jgi:integrase
LGNPFKHPLVDRFVDAFTTIQTDAEVSRAPRPGFTDEQVKTLIDAALSNCEARTREGKPLYAFVQLSAALFCAFAWALMDRGVDLVTMRYSQLTVDDTATPPSITVAKSLTKTDRDVASIQAPVTVVSPFSSTDGDGGKYCLNKLLKQYIAAAQASAGGSVDVTSGYLFRAVRLQKRRTAPACITSACLTTDMLRVTLKALCKQTGVPQAGLHAFRVGKATALRAMGAPSPTIQALGGWRTTAMVDHYSGASTVHRSSKKRRRRDDDA